MQANLTAEATERARAQIREADAAARAASYVLAEIGLDSRRFVMLVIERDFERLERLAGSMNDSERDPWTLYRVLDYATACDRARRAAVALEGSRRRAGMA